MKEIPLTRGYVALVDDQDYEELMQFKWCIMPDRNRNIYAGRTANTNGRQHTVRMHRAIKGVIDPKIKVDHIDHNGLNNQRSNLRVCNSGQNTHNQRTRKGTSKYKGVSLSYGRWMSRITLEGTTVYLGMFGTEEEAAAAYNAKALELHKEFAHLNPMESSHV